MREEGLALGLYVHGLYISATRQQFRGSSEVVYSLVVATADGSISLRCDEDAYRRAKEEYLQGVSMTAQVGYLVSAKARIYWDLVDVLVEPVPTVASVGAKGKDS